MTQTSLQNLQGDKSAAAFATAAAAMGRLVQEILCRWPSQTKNWEAAGIAAVWGKLCVQQNVPVQQLKDGLRTWRKLFPPDFDALVDAADGIDDEELEHSFQRAVAVASTSEFWRISPEIFQAGSAFGWARLRSATASSLDSWRRCLIEARRWPDPEVRGRQPIGPVPALPQPPRRPRPSLSQQFKLTPTSAPPAEKIAEAIRAFDEQKPGVIGRAAPHADAS